MSTLTDQIERKIEEEAGLRISVEEDADRIILWGIVETEHLRDMVQEIAAEAAPDRLIENQIEVMEVMPAEVQDLEISEADAGAFDGGMPGFEEDQALEPGDFTDVENIPDPNLAAGPTGSLDEDVVAEGSEVWVPPTDPVGTNREVIGGFQTTSLDSIEVERSALDGAFGDEAIAEAVRRELREDASTTDLELEVEVEQGVVTLRGRVPLLEDAENAEAVAAAVPGVVEVIDETEVVGLG